MPENWTEDGHQIVVRSIDRDTTPVSMSVAFRCTDETCAGPWLSCFECEGSGTGYDDEDQEQPCSECDGTGYDDGVRQCWIKDGDRDLMEIHGDPPDEGTYRLLYRSEGSGEDFSFVARYGSRVTDDAPTARAIGDSDA